MFCSKCGRQINNDAMFCTFCGSPTMLAAPPAPAAPTAPAAPAPAAYNVPTPQSIPMSSEGYAGANVSVPAGAAGAASGIPAPGTAEYGSEPLFAEEKENADCLDSAADSMPIIEELNNENTENAESSGVYSPEPEYEENTPRSLRLEQPSVSAPLQPVFASYRENAASPELATANDAGKIIDFSAPIQPAEEAEKPTKYYTFGHIALCLAAVGVMAIVAGVFAGLYFSVI